jgi:hypothetical protein
MYDSAQTIANGMWLDYDGTHENLRIGFATGTAVAFPMPGAFTLTYNNAGYLGVGVAAPAYPLDVYGEIHSSSNVSALGGISAAGGFTTAAGITAATTIHANGGITSTAGGSFSGANLSVTDLSTNSVVLHTNGNITNTGTIVSTGDVTAVSGVFHAGASAISDPYGNLYGTGISTTGVFPASGQTLTTTLNVSGLSTLSGALAVTGYANLNGGAQVAGALVVTANALVNTLQVAAMPATCTGYPSGTLYNVSGAVHLCP